MSAIPETENKTCWSCGSEQVWTPTYCNFGHCAECFVARDEFHEECGWDGSEHSSYSPASDLPGAVWIRGDPSKEPPEDIL